MAGFSYWGMNPESDLDYEGSKGLAGAAKQRYDEMKLGATDAMEQYNTGPSLGDVVGSQEEYYKANPEEAPQSMREAVMTGTEKVMDWMNPVPIAGIGSIISKGAKSFDPALVKEASQMLDSGVHPRTVAAETGYFKDYAGHWKTQVSDAQSTITPEGQVAATRRLSSNPAENKYKLGFLMKHDELFYEYPKIAQKTEVLFTTKLPSLGAAATTLDSSKNFSKATIKINPNKLQAYADAKGISIDEALRIVLVHESNHVIQTLDKLPGGSGPGWFKKEKTKLPVRKKELNEVQEALGQVPKTAPRYAELKQQAQELKEHIRFFEKNAEVSDDLLYYNTLGEADAFWAQSMIDDPYVVEKLPMHYDPTAGRQLLEPDVPVNFDPSRSAITQPAYSRFAAGRSEMRQQALQKRLDTIKRRMSNAL